MTAPSCRESQCPLAARPHLRPHRVLESSPLSRCASKLTAVAATYIFLVLLRPSIVTVPLLEGLLAATAAIDVSTVRREHRSVATNEKYDGYITGERGWSYSCELRDWDPLEVTAPTAEQIAMFLYYRLTHS